MSSVIFRNRIRNNSEVDLQLLLWPNHLVVVIRCVYVCLCVCVCVYMFVCVHLANPLVFGDVSFLPQIAL